MSKGDITYFKNNEYRLKILLLVNEKGEKAKKELRKDIDNDYQFYNQLKTMKIRGFIVEEGDGLSITKQGYEVAIKLGREATLIADYYRSEMMEKLGVYKNEMPEMEQEQSIKRQTIRLLEGFKKSLDRLIK
ncbi:hypothetical protein GF352_04135 [archaeon]|nr:hypothetical protein [archaeon]